MTAREDTTCRSLSIAPSRGIISHSTRSRDTYLEQRIDRLRLIHVTYARDFNRFPTTKWEHSSVLAKLCKFANGAFLL